ncbi:MAG: ABC transporter permease [Armatimonadetes bacterium]|nr:ABC transporter permease [Armatimonadota bacterium]MDW8121437.1 ABC transporter permease [Armatimonadota bacterium]
MLTKKFLWTIIGNYRFSAPQISSLLGLCLVCAGLSFATRLKAGADLFLTQENILLVLRQVSFNAIMACGVSVVIITAGIDLSIASVWALASCVTAYLSVVAGWDWIWASAIGLLIGLSAGLINGCGVAFLRLPPFVATLGMMSIARGLAEVLTGGFQISGLPDAMKFWGQGEIALVPVPAIVALVVVLVTWLMLKVTRIGRYLYAIGGNEAAAHLSGVPVRGVKLFAYSFSGLLSSLAGLLSSARLGSARPSDALGYELDAIASAVIGGVSLMGGQGSVLGAAIGAVLIGVLRNGMVLLDVSAFWQKVVIGLVIIIAVALDYLIWRRR